MGRNSYHAKWSFIFIALLIGTAAAFLVGFLRVPAYARGMVELSANESLD